METQFTENSLGLKSVEIPKARRNEIQQPEKLREGYGFPQCLPKTAQGRNG